MALKATRQVGGKNNRRHGYDEECAMECMTYGIFCTSRFCITGILMDG